MIHSLARVLSNMYFVIADKEQPPDENEPAVHSGQQQLCDTVVLAAVRLGQVHRQQETSDHATDAGQPHHEESQTCGRAAGERNHLRHAADAVTGGGQQSGQDRTGEEAEPSGRRE